MTRKQWIECAGFCIALVLATASLVAAQLWEEQHPDPSVSQHSNGR